MAEPEELILEGAHFATRVAREAWRRYGTPADDRATALAAVRARLEMFLTALCSGRPSRSCPWSRRHRQAGSPAWPDSPSRSRARRPAALGHRRTAGLSAGGAAADGVRAGCARALPPPRRGTGARAWCAGRRGVGGHRGRRDARLVPARGSGGRRSLDCARGPWARARGCMRRVRSRSRRRTGRHSSRLRFRSRTDDPRVSGCGSAGATLRPWMPTARPNSPSPGHGADRARRRRRYRGGSLPWYWGEIFRRTDRWSGRPSRAAGEPGRADAAARAWPRCAAARGCVKRPRTRMTTTREPGSSAPTSRRRASRIRSACSGRPIAMTMPTLKASPIRCRSCPRPAWSARRDRRGRCCAPERPSSAFQGRHRWRRRGGVWYIRSGITG